MKINNKYVHLLLSIIILLAIAPLVYFFLNKTDNINDIIKDYTIHDKDFFGDYEVFNFNKGISQISTNDIYLSGNILFEHDYFYSRNYRFFSNKTENLDINSSVYYLQSELENNGIINNDNWLGHRTYSINYHSNDDIVINNILSKEHYLYYTGMDVKHSGNDLILSNLQDYDYSEIAILNLDNSFSFFTPFAYEYPIDYVGKFSGIGFIFNKSNIINEFSLNYYTGDNKSGFIIENFTINSKNKSNSKSLNSLLPNDREITIDIVNKDTNQKISNSVKQAKLIGYVENSINNYNFEKFDINLEADNIELTNFRFSDIFPFNKYYNEFYHDDISDIFFEDTINTYLNEIYYHIYDVNIEEFKLNFSLDYPIKYILLIEDINGFKYDIHFSASDIFEINSEYNSNNLSYKIKSNFPFNYSNSKTFNDLSLIFGSGNYNIDYQSNEVIINIMPSIGYNYTGVIELASIYGDNAHIEVDVIINEIPNSNKFASIYAERYNLLTRDGFWGDKIRLGYNNFTGFDLYIQSCNLGNANFDIVGSSSIEEYFLNCDGEVVVYNYENNSFSFWNEYDINLEIDMLKGFNHFRVSFFDDFRGSKFYTRSNIGSVVKISGEKLYLFNFNLLSGEHINEVDLIIYDSKYNIVYNNENFGGFDYIDLSNINEELLLLNINKDDDENFIVISKSGNSWYYYENNEERIWKSMLLSSSINGFDIGLDSTWGDRNNIKVYGWTDRGIYKPGDKIYFAGFTRNINGDVLKDGVISINLINVLNNKSLNVQSNINGIGAFSGYFDLTDNIDLGNYIINYQFGNLAMYSHDIKIEEYQKPTYFVDTNLVNINNVVYLEISPKYYFGEPLNNFNLDIDYSIESYDRCWYCRFWSNEEFYYNYTFGDVFTDGGNFSIKGYDKDKFYIEVVDLNSINNKGTDINFRFDILIKDNNSDETRLITKYEKIDADVLLGLEGQPIERIYNGSEFEINGNIKDKNSKANNLEYILYSKNFGNNQEKGVDGSYYYIAGFEFSEIKRGKINNSEYFNFNIKLDDNGSGEYFLRIISYNENGNINGEVQKRIYHYGGFNYSYNYWGDIPNNMILDVNIPRKNYEVGDLITINLNPYLLNSDVIITVEKGDEIIDIYHNKLDGEILTIPVMDNYFPFINISVSKVLGENYNIELIDGDNNRIEPRFLIGYGQATISENNIILDIDIDFEKNLYFPGEEVNINFIIKDKNGNPVDGILSVSVVDKALSDLYDIIKEPIPHIYNKIGSFVKNYSNMKLLFDGLKVYVTQGTKGGGGGLSRVLSLRREFKDTAFWDGGIEIKDGKASVNFILPDNLTTWMIDVVAFSYDYKLGTNRDYFHTKQAIMINPNWPNFLTIGDLIKLPVNVVIDSDFEVSDNIKIEGILEFQNGSQIKLGNTTLNENNLTTHFDIHIPYHKFDNDYVKVILTSTDGNFTDLVEWKIPIRSDGFRINDFTFSSTSIGKHTFTLGDGYNKTLDYSLSIMPINAFYEAFKYLLRYPYGCTEQILSGLYPSIIAANLSEKGLLGEGLIDGNLINLGIEGWKSLDDIVEYSLNSIYKNQKLGLGYQNGGLGYRNFGDTSDPYLSAYVYRVVGFLIENGYSIDSEFMKNLEGYLDNIGSLNELAYIYYIYNRKILGKSFNEHLVNDIITTRISYSDNFPYYPVLGFAIFSNISDDLANYYKSQINFDDYNSDYYNNYLDIDILKAIYLQTLIEYDFVKYNEEIIELVEFFLKIRQENGTWGWSTQKNLQIIIALASYINSINDIGNISCVIDINGEEKKYTLDKNNNVIFGNLADINNNILDINWNCTNNLFIDFKTTKIPKDIQLVPNVLNGLSIFEIDFDKNKNIGDIVEIKGKFGLLENANQLALELYIPAEIKLLHNISSIGNSLPFEIVGTNCNPDYYEVRFDRLFLYYNRLNKGALCEVSIKGIKSFNGVFNTMPSNIFEMYNTKVWGRYNPN